MIRTRHPRTGGDSHVPQRSHSWASFKARSSPGVWDFAPSILALEERPPSPLPRAVLYALLVLSAALLAWAAFGRLDVVAVAPGKLVPQNYLQVVQPAEPGIVQAILVKEGDTVAAGQVLMRMDTRLAEADRRSLATELKLKELALRRIDAELKGEPMKRLPDDPPTLYVQVESQHRLHQQAYRDALETERAELARARQDFASAREVEEKLKRTAPIEREIEQGWKALMKEGFAGRLLTLERTRSRIAAEQELKAQTHTVESLKARIARSEKQLAQITSDYRSRLQNERVEVAREYARLKQEWDKHQYRQALLELKAPQAGVVKELATHTPGTVVSPGTILVTLVSQDEPLQAEVWVSNLDAGRVRVGQKAKIKLATYPFQRYGTVEGQVSHLGADASEPPGASLRSREAPPDSAQRGQVPELAYRALIALSAPHLQSGGSRYPLFPGMQVSAEIKLGTRSVLDYLLSSVQKTWSEAGREP